MSVAPTETEVKEAPAEAKAHAHDDAGDALVSLSDKAAEKVRAAEAAYQAELAKTGTTK